MRFSPLTQLFCVRLENFCPVQLLDILWKFSPEPAPSEMFFLFFVIPSRPWVYFCFILSKFLLDRTKGMVISKVMVRDHPGISLPSW